MGFVLTKLVAPVRWLLHLPSNQVSNKEDPTSDPRLHFRERLAVLEEAERDDHKAALALERGERLPEPTKAQLELSKVSFAELFGKFLVADMVAEQPQSEAGPFKSTSIASRVALRRRGPVSVECVVCRDGFEFVSCLNGTCGHFICRQCVIAMAEVATKNEDIFPLQCCQQQLPCAEATTPPNLRIYCPKKTCSNFIGRSPASRQTVMSCQECNTEVCSQCKQCSHPGESCDDAESRGVRSLGNEKGWKTCPRCKMLVERIDGCSHMRCRCRQEFCYNCGGKWARCACV